MFLVLFTWKSCYVAEFIIGFVARVKLKMACLSIPILFFFSEIIPLILKTHFIFVFTNEKAKLNIYLDSQLKC